MYQHFAFVYDYLMKDAPYDQWIDFFTEKVVGYETDMKRVVDLGCGTGELSIRLAEKGFQVTGVDLSEEMLTIAQSKSMQSGVHIPFICQDMRELQGFDGVDAVTIFCDSLNYIVEEQDVQNTFSKIYSQLRNGGILMFDVHSLYKMNQIFLNQTYAINDEDVSYIWNCYPYDWEHSVEHELTFFVKNEYGSYNRFDEYHVQRSFSTDVYKNWLEEAGFKNISIAYDFGDASSSSQAERIFFTAQK